MILRLAPFAPVLAATAICAVAALSLGDELTEVEQPPVLLTQP